MRFQVSPDVQSGFVAAKRPCIAPVEAAAPRTGVADPTTSSTRSKSAARVSRFGGGTFLLDAPLPRRS